MSRAFNENSEQLGLRPHHMFCNRFLPVDLLNRGLEFAFAAKRINELTQSESALIITVVKGPDQLCDYCPDCKNDRCENPLGNEEAIIKWDSKILKGLGLSYGEKITVSELLRCIKKKSPLEFCNTHCPWRTICNVSNY